MLDEKTAMQYREELRSEMSASYIKSLSRYSLSELLSREQSVSYEPNFSTYRQRLNSGQTTLRRALAEKAAGHDVVESRYGFNT